MQLSYTSLLLLSSFIPFSFASQSDQTPMANIAVSPDSDFDIPYTPQTSTQPSLADLLTIENSASIFYSYARELELSKALSDGSLKMTLFVPTNKAVMSLARKPHEGTVPIDEGIEISDQEYDSLTKSNVECWVSAHIVPKAPISLTGEHRTLLSSKSITFKPIAKSSQGPEWSQVTLEDGIRILRKKEASNGDLYMIDGTISPSSAELD